IEHSRRFARTTEHIERSPEQYPGLVLVRTQFEDASTALFDVLELAQALIGLREAAPGIDVIAPGPARLNQQRTGRLESPLLDQLLGFLPLCPVRCVAGVQDPSASSRGRLHSKRRDAVERYRLMNSFQR